jgi:hypothetical protein
VHNSRYECDDSFELDMQAQQQILGLNSFVHSTMLVRKYNARF